jgi:hypothetical protein
MSGGTASGRPDRQGRAEFLDAAADLLEHAGVTTSTMMGLPCLRLHGTFFAAQDRRTADLLVKLDRAEVDRMLDAGEGHAFAPAGRRFREWVAVPPDRAVAWPALPARAYDHAVSRLEEASPASLRPQS